MQLITTTGETVPLGRVLTAAHGPYKGRRFRLVDFHADGERLRVHLLHPHPFRHAPLVLHPSVFLLEIRREVTRVRHALNALHHTWQRVDEWLLAGFAALIPLAFFEHYHWAESITAALGFGGH